MQLSKNIDRIRRAISDRLRIGSYRNSGTTHQTELSTARQSNGRLSSEQQTKSELARLQALIEERKRIARDTDVSHHLWSFYKNYFRNPHSRPLDLFMQEGEWYDVKIIQAKTENGLNKFIFTLKGAKYTFVDDEENQGWSDKTKSFSLNLYDSAGRCIIEVPMKVMMDKWGKHHSVMSDGPTAFLPGEWVNDFINVKLKHQHIHNQEIREQKHKERLQEIEDLKKRFGISD